MTFFDKRNAAEISRVINKMEPEKIETNMFRWNKLAYPAEIMISPIKHRNKHATGYLWVIRDVSCDLKIKKSILDEESEIMDKINMITEMNMQLETNNQQFDEYVKEVNVLRAKLGMEPY